MAVCKFYLQGNCRFGDKCRYEHPQNIQQQQPQTGGAVFGRFGGGGSSQQLQPPAQPRGRSPQGPFQQRGPPGGGFQQQGGSFGRGGGFQQPSGGFGRGGGGGFQQQSSPFARQEQEQRGRTDRTHERWKPDPGREYLRFYRPGHDEFHLETRHIVEDLKDRPEWPLSAFAGHPASPKDLIDASREFSPEEIRVQYYLLRAQGQEQLYTQEEAKLASESAQQIQEISNNLNTAVSYVVRGRNEHPNRWDVINDCNKTGHVPDYMMPNGGTSSTPNQPAPQQVQQVPPQNNFSQPSGFDQPNSFTQPAQQQGFGGQPAPTAQPSGFGQQPAFSQPAGFAQQQQGGIFGNSAPSGAFGATQQPQNEAYPVSQNQPSTFGGFHKPKSPSVNMSEPSVQTSSGFGSQGFGTTSGATNGFSTATNAFAAPTNGFGASPNAFSTTNAINAGGPVQPPPAPGQRYTMSPHSRLRLVLGNQQPDPVPDTQAPDSAYGSDTTELEKVYQHVREKGQFPNGVIPELPPKIEWVGWDW